MRTVLRNRAVRLLSLCLILVLSGSIAPVRSALAASATITVAGTQWGTSTCYIGGTEGNVRFNIADLQDAGVNTYRVYGGMQRWEQQDDDGVFGSPSIAQIKANVNAVNWAWWDNVMTAPTSGSDYWWSGDTNIWQGNARTIFSALQAAGVRPVLTIRNVDNNSNPAWASQLNPPNTTAGWNEWWEHVFATVYWLNVRNNYHVDDFEVHNEPDNASQGWGGTITDYYELIRQTSDAINYVYSTYLPGRTPHIYASVTKGGSSWPDSTMKNAGAYFDSVDIHNYNSDTTSYTQQVHGWMNADGKANAPLWLSEWATYRGGYQNASTGVKTIINNLIRGSRPGNDYIYGSHLFTFYDWDGFAGGFQNFQGLVGPTGTKLASFYALRMGTRALNGCKATYQSTANNSNLLAITTKDAAGKVYLLVTNSSANTSYTVDANLSALLSSGTGTLYQFDATHNDVVNGSPVLSNGHVTFTIPGTAAILITY
ncbi:MAG TPA: hypothetical protein VF914_20110 [Chloroflexia bacterium]